VKFGCGLLAVLVGGGGVAALAQAKQAVQASVTVLGVVDPVTEGQSDRSTTGVEVQPQLLTLPNLPEALRTDSSVDVEQRGGGGVQQDVAIRGSSYELTLVLLNGLRVNDAETSHFNLDVPVSLNALDGVYVLHGAGSTLYGADAVSGVVNLTTWVPTGPWSVRLRAGAASFAGNAQAATVGIAGKRWSEALAGNREFSEGFMVDRDYRAEEASSETRFRSAAGESDVLVAGSDRAYGANQFYGNYNSWERTKAWFAALTQRFDAKMQAAVAYRRHSDVFVLLRDRPTYYQNNHVDQSWQGVVRRMDELPHAWAHVDYGLEANTDQIRSSSLGKHGRNREAGYVSARVPLGKRGSATVGLREEVVGGGPHVLMPSFGAEYRVHRDVKMRGAVTRGFRMPTYTDLYYKDPANVGNAGLKPEFAWNYEGGVDWYPSAKWAVSATGFTAQQSNVIDYVRTDASQAWQAENLTHVGLTGMEASAEWRPSAQQQVRVSLTTVSGVREALNGLQSKYAFNYPSENAAMAWTGSWKNGVTSRQVLRVVNRFNGQTYAVLDSSWAWERYRVKPYVQMTNLTNAGYQEVVGVRMPSRGFAGGVELRLGK